MTDQIGIVMRFFLSTYCLLSEGSQDGSVMKSSNSFDFFLAKPNLQYSDTAFFTDSKSICKTFANCKKITKNNLIIMILLIL